MINASAFLYCEGLYDRKKCMHMCCQWINGISSSSLFPTLISHLTLGYIYQSSHFGLHSSVISLWATFISHLTLGYSHIQRQIFPAVCHVFRHYYLSTEILYYKSLYTPYKEKELTIPTYGEDANKFFEWARGHAKLFNLDKRLYYISAQQWSP